MSYKINISFLDESLNKEHILNYNEKNAVEVFYKNARFYFKNIDVYKNTTKIKEPFLRKIGSLNQGICLTLTKI
jgi:hypothetical protein